MNRDRPATMLTKRESVAKDALVAMLSRPGGEAHTVEEWAWAAAATADALFDVLDTPAELRDEPYSDHEGTP